MGRAGQMRRWGAVSVAVVLLGLLMAAGNNGGCEQFNRMGISPDGNTVAFSLNDEGGFTVNETSAVYKLDLTTCQLTRVSGDKPLAAWADVNADGDVLFTWRSEETGDCAEVALALADGTVCDLTRNRVSDVVPQWLDEERVLLATTRELTDENDDEYEVVLAVVENGELRELVGEFYAESKKRAYWSSLPVWSGDLLAYAAADLIEPQEEDAEGAEQEGGDGDEEAIQPHIYLVSMSTGERRELTSFTFRESDFKVEGEEDGQGPGFVDLAIPSDGKKLAACFLPDGFQEDEDRSWLYLIDVETGETELVKDDVNMYYPRFAPKGEGEPYRVLYLSGTGEEGKGRSVNILNLETRESRKLLSLPGKIMEAYTDWRWLRELEDADESTPRHRLRIYHVSDLGLVIAEVDADGSNLLLRYLDAAKLRLAQVEADLRWARGVAEEHAGRLADLEEALVEAKALTPGPVEFVTVESVPRPSAEEAEEE